MTERVLELLDHPERREQPPFRFHVLREIGGKAGAVLEIVGRLQSLLDHPLEWRALQGPGVGKPIKPDAGNIGCGACDR